MNPKPFLTRIAALILGGSIPLLANAQSAATEPVVGRLQLTELKNIDLDVARRTLQRNGYEPGPANAAAGVQHWWHGAQHRCTQIRYNGTLVTEVRAVEATKCRGDRPAPKN